MGHNKTDIMIKPVETDDELRQAVELMIAEHAADAPDAALWLRTYGQRYPGFAREHTRIAVVKGEVVAALRLTTDTLVLGEARLRMGGIGWVTTMPRYRHRGCCRMLMDDAMAYMRRHRYHLSMLFGIPDLYERFGYVTSLAEHCVLVETTEARTFDLPFRVLPAKPGAIPLFQVLHRGNSAAIPCSILRTTAHFKNRWDRWRDWYALYDDEGRIHAYFIAGVEGNALRVDDVAVAEDGFCAAVLAASGQLAHERGLGRIRFHVPPDHCLARYLLLFRSTHEMHVDRNGGGMLAPIDKGETLESMIPEWENLLMAHAATELHAECTLVVQNDCYRIRVHHGAIDVAAASGSSKVSLTSEDFVHLVTGYRHLEDILAVRRSIIAPAARQLLTVLFPKRHPYMWRFDRF